MKTKIIQIVVSLLLFLIGLFCPVMALKLPIYILSYVVIGVDVFYKAIKNILKREFFDENFLMCIATIGAFCIGEYSEAVAVLLFYQIGEYCNDLAVNRSHHSIVALLDLKSDFALKKVGDRVETVSLEGVQIGDIVLVKPGMKIPLDGVVKKGSSEVDTSMLTGEAMPIFVQTGDALLSGMINQSGVLEIEVTKTLVDSTATRILRLVEDTASSKASTEKFITRFSKYYTPIVILLALFLVIVPSILLGDFSVWLYRGLVFLVISCPCALVISIPLSFFAGIGACSKNGVLVKGGNYLEALNSIDTVFFDKTGTLTKGEFVVEKVVAKSLSFEEFLQMAALAENYSTHPIATSIKKFCNQEVDSRRITSYQEISGFGIEALIDNKKVFLGKKEWLEKKNIPFEESNVVGTVAYMVIDGVYQGYLVISDTVRKTSAEAIQFFRQNHVKTVMLTGDQAESAQHFSTLLNMDTYYGGLLPEDKLNYIRKALKNKKGSVLFVGDGINDAPALMMADVGVSMGNIGSDAAICASGIVLMYSELDGLVQAVKISRYTKRIVWENITFALVMKGVILLLGALGIANMWYAVFADVGVSFLTILNSLRIMKHFNKQVKK